MRRRRKRTRRLDTSAEIIVRHLDKLGLSDVVRGLRIGQLWPQAVGDHIASRTQVAGFTRGVLRIRAASPAWQNELGYLKRNIVAKLNQLMGAAAVRELRILSGNVPLPVVPPPPLPPSEAQRQAARQLSGPIADAAARAAFEALLLKALPR